MEKLLNPYDKEYMRIAMLKHEEAFREQVNELHRLYQMQKILMQEQSVEDRYHGPAAEVPLGCDLSRPVIKDDHFDLELTLGTKSYSYRKNNTGRVTDRGPGFSSNHGKRHGSSSRGGLKWGVDQMAMSSNQDTLTSPPWLFHALSLNMT